MMTTSLRPWLSLGAGLVAVALGSCTCGLPLVAEAAPFAFIREPLLQLCCQCLVDGLPPEGEGCEEGDRGAGCLCSHVSVRGCTAALSGGQSVRVVGACVTVEGDCALDCDQILAFPSEGS